MLITIILSPKHRRQIAFFVKPTVKNPQNSLFTVRNDTEKQQILNFKKLEPAKVQHLCLKVTKSLFKFHKTAWIQCAFSLYVRMWIS